MNITLKTRTETDRIDEPADPMADGTHARALGLTHANGPVVAVCGLAGGAGTSTLAYLIGRYAAAWSSAPMLVTEVEAAAGGLARITGATSPLTLAEIAGRAASDRPAAGLPFVTLDDGLRLIASPPLAAGAMFEDEVSGVLESAQARHALTVVDCGTLQTPGASGALAAATHVVWTVPHAPWTVEQVTACLLSHVAPVTTAAELLAVVDVRRAARGVGRELRNVAAERCRRLVYVPFDKAIAEGETADPRRQLESSLAAIQTFLSRVTTPAER